MKSSGKKAPTLFPSIAGLNWNGLLGMLSLLKRKSYF
jgi:hypothetical protein